MRYQGKYCSAKPPRKRKNNRIWIGTVCALLAVAMIATGTVYAKYKESVSLQGTLTVSAGQLANVFTLQEHKAVRNNGIYILDDTQVVTSNTYQVLPGVAIPKDPHFTLTGKSKVPAYLYVEVIDNLGTSGLSYGLTNDWLALELTGQNGGKVYVYTGGTGSAKLLDESFTHDSPIYILQGNQITVSMESTSGFNVSLSFHGYLAQATLETDAKTAFINCFGGG